MCIRDRRHPTWPTNGRVPRAWRGSCGEGATTDGGLRCALQARVPAKCQAPLPQDGAQPTGSLATRRSAGVTERSPGDNERLG
eukprot:7905359-Alexandrium_andersonii.AAC.1